MPGVKANISKRLDKRWSSGRRIKRCGMLILEAAVGVL